MFMTRTFNLTPRTLLEGLIIVVTHRIHSSILSCFDHAKGHQHYYDFVMGWYSPIALGSRVITCLIYVMQIGCKLQGGWLRNQNSPYEFVTFDWLSRDRIVIEICPLIDQASALWLTKLRLSGSQNLAKCLL